jgi:hypothetical protein
MISKIPKIKNYLNNPNLKRTGVDIPFTAEQKEEIIKCSKDPVYFIEKYVKFITDDGYRSVSLYPFQKEAIFKMNDNRKIIVKAGRQIGKTTMVAGYILWFVLFNDEKFVAILANRAKTSREILNKVRMAYESLPVWMQQGVKVWNKGDIELENKSRIMADSTAGSAIRGMAVDFLYLDEYAFVPPNIADEFYTSVYPTISSRKNSKILITSTPKGLNHYYKMWTEAEQGINGFITIQANWRQIPGRTQAWADEERASLGETKYLQEVETEFLGSSGTLISGAALKRLAYINPIQKNELGLSIYYEPEAGRNYMTIADTSRGKGLDYSAFVVLDVTEIPYKLVATFKNNEIAPLVYPGVIQTVSASYNNAPVIVENNDNGQQVADSLFDDYAYENVLCTVTDKKKIALSWGETAKATRGVRTTKSVKRFGCSTLKHLIENDKLIIQDFDTISELSTFVLNKTSYEAEEGKFDDLVMCLVLFSWATNEVIFREISDSSTKSKLYSEQIRAMEEDMPPGFLAGHIDIDEGQKYERIGGELWTVVQME